MRYLVTGASGMIGMALTERLAEAVGSGNLQLVVSPKPQHAREAGRLQRLRAEGHSILAVDLLEDDFPSGEVKPFDVLYHLAAFTHTEQEGPHMRVNDEGTRRLLEALGPRLRGTKVVYAGSIAAVDRGKPGGGPLDETSPCVPLTQYGQTKWAGENFVIDLAGKYGYEKASLRLPTVCGKGYRPGGMFDRIKRGLATGSLEMRLNWPGRISLAGVSDAVDAFVALARKGNHLSGVFHLGAEESPRFDTVIDESAHILGLPRRRFSMPPGFWPQLNRAAWALRNRPLPRPLRIAVWRLSLVASDGLVSDPSALQAATGLAPGDWRRALAQTYSGADQP